MEYLDRGFIAIKVSSGVYLSWRYLGTDDPAIGFNVYRNGVKVSGTSPITTSTNYTDSAGTAASVYTLKTVLGGVETAYEKEAAFLTTDGSLYYRRVALQKPADGTIPKPAPDNVSYTYSANDASVGDVDGDGEYEIFVKWDPSNSKDNSQVSNTKDGVYTSGYTGNVYIDCYKMNGTRLWRIDLGRNIRAGAHYTQFLVYDFDGDGKAELICKTADGTIDGTGAVIGDANKNNVSSSGTITSGNEYLSAFRGIDGAVIDTVNYLPARSIISAGKGNTKWDDDYGNRSERYLACVAYLDGQHPSAVMCRGYYTHTFLVAWRLSGGKLVQGNHFYTTELNADWTKTDYARQGNHSVCAADVDGDGKDEILYGAMALNSDLTPRYTTNLQHGDAQHTGDFIPSRPGLETFSVHEDKVGLYDWDLRDSGTGAIIWGGAANPRADVGRGLAADIDPRYPGAEYWTSSGGVFDAAGNTIFGNLSKVSFAIWWDGDLGRELLDLGGSNANNDKPATIYKWRSSNGTYSLATLVTLDGAHLNNGTKANVMLQADLYGDWREEVIAREPDSAYMRIYSTASATTTRLYTLMHNPQYRVAIAWQNVSYHQPPQVSYHLGYDMAIPPQPNITAGR
jgi:rhamnogalacturonan endolyase